MEDIELDNVNGSPPREKDKVGKFSVEFGLCQLGLAVPPEELDDLLENLNPNNKNGPCGFLELSNLENIELFDKKFRRRQLKQEASKNHNDLDNNNNDNDNDNDNDDYDEKEEQEKEKEKEKMITRHGKPIIFVDDASDFPSNTKSHLSNMKPEDIDNHFEIVVRILNFRVKDQILKLSEKKKREILDSKGKFEIGIERARELEIKSIKKGHRRHGMLRKEELISSLPNVNMNKVYKNMGEAGRGGFGRVYFADSSVENKRVAIKMMGHKSRHEIKSNFREAQLTHYCHHPNIVEYYTSYIVKNEFWMILEFLEGGSFTEAVSLYEFNETHLAYIAKQLLKAISWMHAHKIAHRDLKSANIMMSVEGHVKIVDFGLCEDFKYGPSLHMCGSPFWMPPEMILGKPHSYPVDIWSLGISLLEMANRKPPRANLNPFTAMFLIAIADRPWFDDETKWSDQFNDFLDLCLKYDPDERATALELLGHPFLKKSCTIKEMSKILSQIFVTSVLNNAGMNM